LQNYCFLLVFKDGLFKQILSNLLVEMNNGFEIYESTAEDVDDLLTEVSKLSPDTILLQESSPLSKGACLIHILRAIPGRPVVVVSQEHNLMHVVHWRTVYVETVNDLIESIRPV